MINKRLLNNISADFLLVSDILQQSAEKLILNNFKYPLFIVTKLRINIFPTLIGTGNYANEFNYQVGYLDLLLQKNIFDVSKKQHFIDNYKDSKKYCCIFLIDDEFKGIIYLPYSRSNL